MGTVATTPTVKKDDDIIEGEVVGRNLPAVVREDAQALVPAATMTDLLKRGAEQATIIADLLRKQNLVKRIGTSDHVLFEAWVAVATANGKRLDTIEQHNEGTRGGVDFTASACVGLRDIQTGEVVAKAWASCSRRESNWKSRDDYAIESMAQTRAGGKVSRMVYGWIIALAGFQATPVDEIPASHAPSGANGDVVHRPEAVARSTTVVDSTKPAAMPWTDEQRDGFKNIYKAVHAQRNDDQRATAAIERFTTFMKARAFSKWEYLWAHDDLRADAFRIFGMDDPALTNAEPTPAPVPPDPMFDPDNMPT